MRIVREDAVGSRDELVQEVVDVLRDGGLACLPCNGTYRIFADLQDPSAVENLLQTKRRVHKAPSLVFVDSVAGLKQVAEDLEPEALAVAEALWPGPVTVLVSASSKLPRKVVKELTKANGKLGVRIPESDLALAVVRTFGGPVLVSSANRGRKSGESSAAQVRQNLGRGIDLFIDAGDLEPVPSSTVIDVKSGDTNVIRPGAIPEELIRQVLVEMA